MSAQAYTVLASYYHWLVAAPLMGSVASVMICQQSPKEEKGKWCVEFVVSFKYRLSVPYLYFKNLKRMFRHKSLGLLTGLIVAPRLGYRVFNAAKYQIGHPTGTGPIEAKLADASHFLLYGFMTIMPATGIAMGYYGGKGLPFFWTTIPGAKEANGDIAKKVNNYVHRDSDECHQRLIITLIKLHLHFTQELLHS
ncbi:hypothetical protein HJC23_001443 [Cyclotella cryptica]|uniref:Cytochrome b561 bacterial/Ni-hydrogenase domain-containing protein n=1 Tax=Cyclotella cryptica TaxID=29204 RepID=A0ABD3P014_9STRA